MQLLAEAPLRECIGVFLSVTEHCFHFVRLKPWNDSNLSEKEDTESVLHSARLLTLHDTDLIHLARMIHCLGTQREFCCGTYCRRNAQVYRELIAVAVDCGPHSFLSAWAVT